MCDAVHGALSVAMASSCPSDAWMDTVAPVLASLKGANESITYLNVAANKQLNLELTLEEEEDEYDTHGHASSGHPGSNW
eukprot:3324969-Prymnesium_polylepis.1